MIPTSGPPTVPGARGAPVPSRKTASIIWGALLTGVVTFAAVAAAVGPSMRRAATEELGPVLGGVAGVMSLVGLVASIVVPRLARQPAGTSAEGLALTRTIIASALNEGAALFAVVAWMITGTPWALLALAISLFGLLRAFPSEGRWRALGGLGPEPRGANRLVR